MDYYDDDEYFEGVGGYDVHPEPLSLIAEGLSEKFGC